MTDFLQVTSFDPLVVEAPAGQDGAQGPQGPVGPQGPTGATGPQGPPGAGGGAVSSVNTQTGAVVLSAANVGADASGAATAAQTAAQTYADTNKLAKSANLSDVATPATARTNLGLGTAAVANKVAAGSAGVLDASDASTTNSRSPNGSATGDLSGNYPAPNVAKINGTSLAGLATGVLKNTTATGVPSIAVAADIPTVAAGTTGPLSATDATTTNARTPTAHATTHKLAGSDAIRLDELALPTASVALNAQKITGLGNPTLSQDAVTLDVASGVPTYALSQNQKNRYDNSRGLYNFKASNSRILDQGRADAMTAGITEHVWIGDSVSAGATSGIGVVTYDRLHAPALCFRDQLAGSGIRANGTGHVRINDAGTFDARWTTVAPTGTWVATSNQYSQNTVAGTATLVVDRPGSIVEVAYVDFGGATVTVSIDGASSGANFGTFSTTAGAGTTPAKFRMTGCTVNINSKIKLTVTVLGTGFKLLSAGTWYPNGGLVMHNISQSGSGAFTDGSGATSGAKVWSDLTAGTGGGGAYWFALLKNRRQITDAATTAASTTLTSATAAFTTNDQGNPIDQFPDATGALFPPNTYMVTRISATQMTMSNPALVTATAKTLNLGRDPHCIHIALGGNDTMAAVATNAQIRTAITTIRNQFPNSDVILHLENEPQNPGMTTAAKELAFQQSGYQLADTLDAPLYDWRDRAGNYATAFANGVMQDYQAHMIPGMYADLGSSLAQALGGGSGPLQSYAAPFYPGDVTNKQYVDQLEMRATTSTATATTTVEAVVLKVFVPANTLKVGSTFDYSMWLSPAATTITTVKVRVGPLGTTADAAVITMSASAATNAGARLAQGVSSVAVAGASATHIGGGTEAVGAINAAGVATTATGTFDTTQNNWVSVTVTNTSSTTTTCLSGRLSVTP